MASTIGKKTVKKKKQTSSIEEKAKSFGSLVVTLIVVLFVQSFFIQGYSTPTGSMLNTILIGDKMFFNQFIYGGSTPRFIPFTEVKLPYFQLPAIRDPRRGDIVNFEFPGNREEVKPSMQVQYLKRCVGEPGDKIEVINQVLFVNGEKFPWPEAGILALKPTPKNVVNQMIFPKGKQWNEDNYGPIVVPKKGDLVNLSKENYIEWDTFIKREGHKIEMKGDGKITIDGKETGTYTVENNYYFMMGDNRNNSLDSRFWGFVKREAVVGKAWFTYFSWNSEIPFGDFGRLVGSIRWDRIGKSIK